MRHGLASALCAYSFFRSRHNKRPLYRRSRKKNVVLVSQRDEMVSMARHFIRKARTEGWRGSFRNAILRGLQ